MSNIIVVPKEDTAPHKIYTIKYLRQTEDAEGKEVTIVDKTEDVTVQYLQDRVIQLEGEIARITTEKESFESMITQIEAQ